jgi:hypothetical protein
MVAAAPLFPPLLDPGEEPDESVLVTEDEKQERLLTEPLYSSWAGPPPAEDGATRSFAALANVGLFSSVAEPPVVPDVMLSLDVTIPQDLSQKKNRSYFLWRYGKPPEVVIEIVSNRKEAELGERRRRYQRMHVEHYIVYDPLKELGESTLQTFELRTGRYVALERPWFEGVGLGLAEWDGAFEGMTGRWLRWHTRDGQLVPTGAERAESERIRAENERARAENERVRAENAEARVLRLAARLRELGIDEDGGDRQTPAQG